MRKSLHTIVRAAALPLALVASTGLALADAPQGREGAPPERRREVVVQRVGGPGAGVFFVGRGFLGIGLVEMTPELRAHFGAPKEAGILVSKVEAGSPAESAGLKVGDVVTAIDGEAVDSSWAATSAIRKHDAGDTVALEVYRDGRPLTLNATVAERERSEVDLAPMFWKRQDGDDVLLQLDPDKLPKLERFELTLPEGAEGPRVIRLREREAELEKRLKELEKRIQELEGRLKK